MTEKNHIKPASEAIKTLRHDVNNNLMIIFGYTELLLKNQKSQEYVDNIEHNIDKAIENLKKIKSTISKI